MLTEFARTLTPDFPIQAILDHLVVRIVDVLPFSAAGVTLIPDGTAPHHVAASDASALRYGKLRYGKLRYGKLRYGKLRYGKLRSDVGEGPGLSAYRTGEIVPVPDLASDGRFPLFGPPAVEAGLAAVWTFPPEHGGSDEL